MAASDFTALTTKQRLYAQVVAQGKTKAEAKRVAGYSATTSTTAIESSSVKAAFSRLVRQYIPAHHLAKRIAEGLDATETKFFQMEGQVTDSRDVIAWGERHKYAKLAAEYGAYVEPNEKTEANFNGPAIVLINGITKRKE